MISSIYLVSAALTLGARAQTYSATYSPNNLPATTQQGQFGTNACGEVGKAGSNQTSLCQNSYINALDDFCLWGPPNPGADSVIGNTERFEVSWCLKSGYGTRLIPDGAITGAHFVKTPDFVQVTGVGDFSLLNIPKGDAGGELDPHGADGNGNPIGGLVFSSAFSGDGSLQQLHEWTNFMAADQFCFRACKEGGNGVALCQHIYDTMGCAWNMPANYDAGVFESCQGDSGEPMGVYGGSTWQQGQPNTPPPHPAPSSSNCKATSTIGNGLKDTSSASSSTMTSAHITTTSSTETSKTVRLSSATSTTNAGVSVAHMGSEGQWDRIVYAIGSALLCTIFAGAAVL